MVVERPSAEIEAQVAAGAERWLPDIATEANGDGEKLLTELGFDLGNRRIGRRVHVEVGVPRTTAGLMFMPLRWRAASEAGLFPTLEGELEVAALGADRTQLGFSANYQPPLGVIGKLADRALFHRVAEATINDLLARIVKHLDAAAG